MMCSGRRRAETSTTELDYTEQTSWLLFLKYLDDLEYEKAIEAELLGKPYTFCSMSPIAGPAGRPRSAPTAS
jgi:hypothetical protein